MLTNVSRLSRPLALSSLAFACGLVACGGQTSGPSGPPGPGNPCGSCASYQLCSTVQNRCVIDRTSSWFFSVSDAALDKARDSYFVLDGRRSTVQKSTQFPAWAEGGVYTAGQLLDTGAAVEIFDSGFFVDTSLSQPRKVLLSESNFGGTPLVFTGWDKVSTVTFDLTAR
jgi:hypothetical protein